MEIFNYLAEHNHEEVVFWSDKTAGLRAIVAIHSTVLGPALGGCRMWPYVSEEDALLDVLRLAEGMTYKASLAGLDFGGGKAVIIGDPARDKSAGLWQAFGKFINSLHGRYITGEDVGTTVVDMALVHQSTPYVVGLPKTEHGSGDPSPVTAFGVYRGIRACCRACFGLDDLRGRTVAVQGLGKVGAHLARLLAQDGARLVASELNAERAAKIALELGIKLVPPDDIYEVKCDVFAPCALGAVINDTTIGRLRCRIVAGAANNQLADDQLGFELAERNILFAPDYVINAGGIISIGSEVGAFDAQTAWHKTSAIYDSLLRIVALSREEGVPTHLAAHRLAQARIELVKQEHAFFAGRPAINPK